MTHPAPQTRSTSPDVQRPEFRQEIERGERKLQALFRGRALPCPARDVLIAAQTEHSYVYRLTRGWMSRSRLLEDGRNQLILVFLPGDLFAVKSLFMTCHPDSVPALTDCVVERVGYQELHALYVCDSDIASRCLWQVMEEERRLHNWVVGLGQGDAEERLAMLLLDLRARLAISGAIGFDAMTFELPLTQVQLGDYLGLTAVHVNRVLRALREAGTVSLRDGVATIEAFDRLVKRAYPLLDAYERTNPAYVGPLARLADPLRDGAGQS